MCLCDYTVPGPQVYSEDFSTPHAYREVGRARAKRMATGASEDRCEVRQTYLTDSVCLLDSSEFAGCDLAEPNTSCADTCEQLRVREVGEAEAQLSGIELLGASCGEEDCSKYLCHGAFRAGDRCYKAVLGDLKPSLGEVSCDLPPEKLQSLDLSSKGSNACPNIPTPAPYCTEGPAPTTLVFDWASVIRGMAIDSTYLYWYTDAALLRQPKAGGATEKVAEPAYGVKKLVSDSSRLYWQYDSLLFSLPLDGRCAPEFLTDDANVPEAWAVRDSTVYYLSDLDAIQPADDAARGLHRVQLQSLPSSGGTPALLASTRINFIGGLSLVVNATGVYWSQPAFWSYETSSLQYPEFEKYSFTEQSVTTFATTMDFSATYLQAAGDRVLWGGDGVRWSSLPDGSDVVDLGSIQGLVASDGTRAYWPSSSGGGNIVTAPLAGGPARLSSCVVFTPGALLADDDALYYLSKRGDLIARLPKPAAP